MSDFISYSEFKTQVRAILFPEGEAENLQTTHDAYIQDALIKLQTFVPCLRSNNVNFYDKEDMREWCGLDFLHIPRGVVHAVYAFNPTSRRCRKHYFSPKSVAYVDGWIAQQRCTTCGTTEDNPSLSPDCDEISDADTYCDSVDDSENDNCFKSTRKYYSLGPDMKLYLMPRLPCGYKIAVHWEGLKRSFSNNDPIPDDMDLVNAVVKYVMGQRALFLDHDVPLYEHIMAPRTGEFSVAQADMIHRCTKERQVQQRHQSINSFDVLQPFFYDPLPEPDDVFAVISDWGNTLADPDSVTAVEGIVNSWAPEFIVTAGDNKYDSSMADVISTTLNYANLVANELFYPAIGNHDLTDGGGLADFIATFPYIEDKWTTYRNYSIRKNHVEFFFMETHDSTSGPTAVPNLTQQSNWLQSALNASTAKFKVVITQDPPYVSDADVSDYPGHDGSQLDYAGFGADLVISGDSHLYERLEVDGFPYIVCGLGGATKNEFNAIPVDGSLVRYNADFGALRGRCTPTQLILKFINTSGQEIDSLTISK